MTKRRRPNDIAVYFNEEQPFDLVILSAVETIREGTSLSKGACAKRLLALGALVMEGVDARSFIQSMKFGAASERWRLKQRLRGVQPDSPPSKPAPGARQDRASVATPERKRRKPNEMTVYFNEQDQPFESTTLSAVEKIREGTALSKGSGAKRVMALGALVFGDVDARPFIRSMKLGTASERWQLEQLLRGVQPDSPPNKPHSSAVGSVPLVARGPAQTELHDKTAAATPELSKPIQVDEEISRAGAATQHIAPPPVSQSPANGLLSRWKSIAIAHSVEVSNGRE